MYPNTQQHYDQHKLLIMSRARAFARTTGHDFDDLFSQGNLIYCLLIAQAKHNGRAKFSTLLYRQLNQGLFTYTMRLSTFRSFLGDEIPEGLPVNGTQHRSAMFWERLEAISNEARGIACTIMRAPEELFGREGGRPRKLYGKVIRRLRSRGLSWSGVRNCLKELRWLAYNK